MHMVGFSLQDPAKPPVAWSLVITLQNLKILKGSCHGNQFYGKIANSRHLSLWHSEAEWNIATSMCALT